MQRIVADEIVIRRRHADALRTPSDVAVSNADAKSAARSLKQILQMMQRERGVGTWSDADPKVLAGGAVVGTLRKHEIIDDLVEHVLDRVVRCERGRANCAET